MEGFGSFSSNRKNEIVDWSRTAQSPSIQQTVVLHLPPKELYQWQQNRQRLWQQQQQKEKAVQNLPLHSPAFPEHSSKATSIPNTIIPSHQLNQSFIHGVPVALPLVKGYGGIPIDYKSGGVYPSVSAIGGFRGATYDPCAGCPSDAASDTFGVLGNLIKEQLNLVPYMILLFLLPASFIFWDR